MKFSNLPQVTELVIQKGGYFHLKIKFFTKMI